MKIKTINPATESILHQYSMFTQEQVDQIIVDSSAVFQSWRQTDVGFRSQLMRNMARCLRSKQDELAKLMALEMGKPITAGKSEIEKCAWVCEYYADTAPAYLQPRFVKTDLQKSLVCYQPLGLIFAIMPWNYPFWQVYRFAVPNLMAGNVGLLKHASISTGTGNAIRDLFLEAGFPEHVFEHLIIDKDMAAYVIAHEQVRGVTLTGSEKAGKTIASLAGAHLKKTVLELGGNDPYVVLADADLDVAAEKITMSRLNNMGQTCIAAKRVIVVKSVASQLLEKILALLKNYSMGDPLDPNTKLGPMARPDLRETVHQQVLKSMELGAQLVTGGVIPQQTGYFYPPTILTGVCPGMPAFDDELFGPVFAIIEAHDELEAIRLANQTRFGLGAAVFTRDLVRGEKIARDEIESGTCVVNGMVVSDPRLPFGGVKHSGFGRELSHEGFLEFMNIKTIGVYE